ncbi:MAG: nickel-dependent hydrogenase large subunit [Pseudomonadota bacterium]|nr:nickel-dependent hydrogenase large subunit [Pseudomonadota bacterium]
MSLEFATQRLRLVPGAAIPVLGLREPLAERLLHGRAAALAPALLGRLYALCGQAHRICAEMALQALQTPETPIPMDASQRQALWRETLREHVRRLFLDWPRLLARPAPEGQALAASPALGQSVLPGDAGLVEWVERQVLGMPWVRWQRACQQNPAQGLLQWAHAVHNPLTQALVQAHRWAGAWQVPLQALHTPQPGAQVLTDLASALRADGDFARQPRLREQCRETGCWTRADDAWLPVPDVWTRLAARVWDLAQLAQTQGAQRLHAGACALGAGEAIAWCEMARGLLVHWLRVDAQGRVERYGVLAPTEWNFHPQGAAAQVLRGLDAQQPAPQLAAAVAVLVAAFDPCVDYALAPVGHAEEVSCA